MQDGPKNLATLIVVAAMGWHLLAVLTPAWVVTFDQQQGRDFASYYYAVQVAAEGGDPYVKPALNKRARADGNRRGVHPFLYAPPFLTLMAWTLPLDLPTAFHTWFWLHEALAIAAAAVLILWWRRLGDAVPWLVALCFALMTAIPNNHAMGQANLAGFVLALAGLWQTDARRPHLGGALMGAASMLKMSPALFVAWWMLRREWTAVGSAIATAVVLSVVSLPLIGFSAQLRFYTEILPTFGSGLYNNLGVPIGLFGNHSIPNVLHQLFPSAGRTLSPAAQALSTVTGVGLMGALAVRWRHPDPTALQRAAQAASVGVLLLLVPVYTYEHHLVFALPAAVLGLLAIGSGALRAAWAAPVAVAVAVLLFDLRDLKAIATASPGALGVLVQEAKFASLLVLLAATATLGGQEDP